MKRRYTVYRTIDRVMVALGSPKQNRLTKSITIQLYQQHIISYFAYLTYYQPLIKLSKLEQDLTVQFYHGSTFFLRNSFFLPFLQGSSGAFDNSLIV